MLRLRSRAWWKGGIVLLALALIGGLAPFVRAAYIGPVQSQINAMRVVGKVAYLVNDTRLELVDVGDPQDAALLGTIGICSTSYDLDVVGDYAYVLGLDCLDVFDVHDPSAPVRLSTLSFPDARNGFARHFSVVDGLAYMPFANSDTMAVIDVHDPAAPQLSATVSVRPGTFGLHAEGGQDALAWRAAIISPTPPAPAVQYAYSLGDGSSLNVVDVHDPANPKVVGSLTLPDYAEALWVDGDRAYVDTDTDAQLSVIDVSQPTAPRLLATYRPIPDFSTLVATGGRVYVRANESLLILDATSVPLQQVGGYAGPPVARAVAFDRYGTIDMQVSAIVVDGGQALAADAGGGVSRYDLADPAHPKLVARRLLGSPAGQIAVVSPGQVAAVVQGDQVVLLRESDLLPVGRVGVGQDARIALDGATLYALDSGALQIFDLSNPAAAVLRGSLALSADQLPVLSSTQIAASGGIVAIASPDAFQAVDVRDPAHPVLAGQATYPSLSSAYGLTLAGGRAYVLGYQMGGRGPGSVFLQAVDLGDPLSPRSRGRLELPFEDSLLHLAIVGDVVYLADSALAGGPGDTLLAPSGFGRGAAISVADPDSLQKLASGPAVAVLPSAFGSTGVADGGLLYSAGPSGMLVYDLYAAGGPALRGVLNGWPDTFRPADGGAIQPHELQVAGGYALMVNGNALLVVDVRDPARPQAVGMRLLSAAGVGTSYTSGSFAARLAIADRRVYMVDSQMLEVIDFSNPAAPALLGTAEIAVPYDIDGALAVSGSTVYLSMDSGLLQVIDAGDPAHPAIRGRLQVGKASDIRVEGGRLSLFGETLATVDVSDPAHPALVDSVVVPPAISAARRLAGDLVLESASTDGSTPPRRIYDIGAAPSIRPVGSYAGCRGSCPLPPPGPAVGVQVQQVFVDQTGEILRLAIYPSLNAPYRRGAPGSAMLIRASDLPPHETLELRVNDVLVGSFDSGAGSPQLSLGFSADAAPGAYLVSVQRPGSGPLASTTLRMSDAALAVQRTDETGSTSFSSPSTILPATELRLPLVIR